MIHCVVIIVSLFVNSWSSTDTILDSKTYNLIATHDDLLISSGDPKSDKLYNPIFVDSTPYIFISPEFYGKKDVNGLLINNLRELIFANLKCNSKRGIVEITEKGKSRLKTANLPLIDLQNDIDLINHRQSVKSDKGNESVIEAVKVDLSQYSGHPKIVDLLHKAVKYEKTKKQQLYS